MILALDPDDRSLLERVLRAEFTRYVDHVLEGRSTSETETDFYMGAFCSLRLIEQLGPEFCGPLLRVIEARAEAGGFS